MAYIPAPIPTAPESLRDFLQRELRAISGALGSVNSLQLKPLGAAPGKYSAGTIVYADGTNWDPGSGEGIYAYYNAQWNKLG